MYKVLRETGKGHGVDYGTIIFQNYLIYIFHVTFSSVPTLVQIFMCTSIARKQQSEVE